MVKLSENGEILYICRKDFQIKRMGYRIELGEIEAAASAVSDVSECACIFDKDSDSIILFYSAAKTDEKEMTARLAEKINGYMLPDKIYKTAYLPHNQNGKIDRKELEKRIKDGYDY